MNTLETKIYETKDYDLFVSDKTNRRTMLSHIANLASSIKERNLLIDQPILVTPKTNGKHIVIDGQNRLEACKLVGCSVWFRISEKANIDDVKILNMNAKNWTSKDFLNFYMNKGDKNYVKFHDFFIWSGLRSVDCCIKLFCREHSAFKPRDRKDNSSANTGGSRNSQKFKKGLFMYPESDSEQRLHITRLKEIAGRLQMEKWDNVSLWAVYFNCILNTEGYDHKRMLKQLESYPVMEYKKGFPNAQICVDVLQDVYNKRLRYENQFLFNRNKLN